MRRFNLLHEMKWIEIKGGIGEQMLRYAQAMAESVRGEDVELVCADEGLWSVFPRLPHLNMRRYTLAERVRGFKRGESEDSWLNYRYAESLGDAASTYFATESQILPKEFGLISEKLVGENTVAVHVYRPGKKGSSCTPDYYNWAITGMRQWLGDAQFVVITDNKKLSQQCIHFGDACVEWIELAERWHKYIFELLRQASHCITSDTIESWWGAWLNKNEDKIVTVPQGMGKSGSLIPYYWTVVPLT